MRPIIILLLLAGPMSPSSRGQANETSPGDKPTAKTQTAQPDVLSLIPADVELAISIPSLAVFDAQAATTLGRLGLSTSDGVLTPVLDWLEIVEGVDQSRSAAMAIWPVEKSDQDRAFGGDPHSASRKMALFIPTDSLESLIRFHAPSPTGDGTFRVTIRGRPSWVTQRAGYAIFATDEKTLRAIQQSSRALRDDLSPKELHHWAASEVVVFGNPSVGHPGATLFSLAPNATPWLTPAADLLQRAQRWLCAMRFEENGLAMDVIATTLTASRNQSATPTTESGLLGIPLEPIACAFRVRDAHSIDTHVIPLVNLLVPSQGTKAGNSPDQWHYALRGLLRALDGFSFSLSSATDAAGPPINFAATAKLRSKPKRLHRAIESLLTAIGKGTFTSPRMTQVMSKLMLKSGVESAAGVTIDHLILDTESFEGLNRQAIVNAFGADGLTLRLAIIDDRHLVITLGGGLDRFLRVVNAVRSGRSPIDANARVIRAAKHIHKHGFLEAYVSPGRLNSMRQTMARLIENAVGQRIPERATELVGLTAETIGGNTYHIGLFLPDDALAGFLSLPAQRTARQSPR